MPKFNIGDSVLSNKLGLPCVYTVVGMMQGDSYKDGLEETFNKTGDIWEQRYPGWSDNMVYYAKSSPQKPLSYQEYLEQNPDGNPDIYNMMPDLTVWALPEADLVSLDNLFD